MAIILKVRWVEKSDEAEPYRQIKQIGGISNEIHWRHSQAQAIDSIEHGMFTYFVEQDTHAMKLDVGVTSDGIKYLTVGAGGPSQLLLDLPEFPTKAVSEIERHSRV